MPKHNLYFIAISIHAPHEGERRVIRPVVFPLIMAFQSTLPTRGSDGPIAPQIVYTSHFNPRSPRGGATLRPSWPKAR